VLGDQEYNAMQMQEMGTAIQLEIGEVTENQLQGALSRILYDGSFKQNVIKMSTLFLDLPMKPMDTAVFWIEYVLRHDDFSHLKPLARNQTWYQRRMLDVWLVLFLTLLTGILLLIMILTVIFKCLQQHYFNTGSKIKTS
jgi:glucuronosyltransferase